MNKPEARIAIAATAFFLAIVILGYMVLTWNGSSQTIGQAGDALQIEAGALVYHEHCANCHGDYGRENPCDLRPAGEGVECMGTPLNGGDFHCRFQLGAGPTMEKMGQHVADELAAERTARNQSHQGLETLSLVERDAVTAYVVNFHDPQVIVECRPTPEPVEWHLLIGMNGDPINGEILYDVTFGCGACHGTLEDSKSALVGPWLGMMQDADYEPPIDGYSAADFLFEATLLPSIHMSEECPMGPCSGPPSAMPANYAERITIEDLADVMAFVLQTNEPFEWQANRPRDGDIPNAPLDN